MTELLLSGVSDPWLGPLTLNVTQGLHVLSGDAPPLGRLVEIATGFRKPRKGQVLLAGRSVAEPSTRRRLAALLPEEELLVAPSVEQALADALSFRRSPLGAAAVLEAAGLARLAPHEPARLDGATRRAVALALALADTGAEALVLYDPLTVSAHVPRAYIIESILLHASTKPVLVATPHLEDTLILGGSWLTLVRGAIVAPAASEGTSVSVALRSEQARKLAGLLAGEPGVIGIAFDGQRSPFELLVRATDAEILSDSVTRIACAHSIPIASLIVTADTAPRTSLSSGGSTSALGARNPS